MSDNEITNDKMADPSISQSEALSPLCYVFSAATHAT